MRLLLVSLADKIPVDCKFILPVFRVFFNFLLTVFQGFAIMNLTNGRFINSGGKIMALSNLEKQQARLEKLNNKIRLEKEKIERNLGREIIKNSNLDYSDFTKEKIAELGSLLGSQISSDDLDHSNNETEPNNNGSTNVNKPQF